MQKMILVIAAVFLTASASVNDYAQNTEKKDSDKKETTTADAWRQALPASEQSSNALVVDMEDSRDTVEAKETAEQIETRILELEGRLIEAFKGRDSSTLKQLLAEDFMPAGANITDSQSNKTRFIESTLKNSETKTYAAEKTKARVYTTATAIVTTYYKQKTIVDGVPTDVDFTATDVWLKRKKLWQAVSHHVSQLPQTAIPVPRSTQAKQTPE